MIYFFFLSSSIEYSDFRDKDVGETVKGLINVLSHSSCCRVLDLVLHLEGKPR